MNNHGRKFGALFERAKAGEQLELHPHAGEVYADLEIFIVERLPKLQLPEHEESLVKAVFEDFVIPVPPGRWEGFDKEPAKSRVAYLWEIGKQTYKEVLGIDRIRTPDVVRPQDNVPDQLLRSAIRLVVQNDPSLQGQIDLVEMRSFRTQPTRSVADWVNDNMPASVQQMQDLARRLAGAVVG